MHGELRPACVHVGQDAHLAAYGSKGTCLRMPMLVVGGGGTYRYLDVKGDPPYLNVKGDPLYWGSGVRFEEDDCHLLQGLALDEGLCESGRV